MENYVFIMRCRANQFEPYDKKHEIFINQIKNLNFPWNLADKKTLPDIGPELMLVIPLGKSFNEQCRGNLSYLFRCDDLQEDLSANDDLLYLEFKPSKVNFKDLIINTIPCYTKCFHAYRATVFSLKVARLDRKNIRELSSNTGKNIDGRDSVYRINNVNYFDRELCRRAFNLTPEQIFERLSGRVEHIEMINDGVYFVCTPQILTPEELVKIDARARDVLGVPIEAEPIQLS